jgi:hypothetical protein
MIFTNLNRNKANNPTKKTFAYHYPNQTQNRQKILIGPYYQCKGNILFKKSTYYIKIKFQYIVLQHFECQIEVIFYLILCIAKNHILPSNQKKSQQVNLLTNSYIPKTQKRH